MTAGRGLIILMPLLLSAPGAVAADDNDQFALNCAACHGVALEGIEGLGVSLAESAFVRRSSVQDLVAFLKVGRMPGDPGSVMGRPMPGFAWLPEADLAGIATYLKSQHDNR